MPFLKLPAVSTLPQVPLTPDQVKPLGIVSLAEARRMACRYPAFRQIVHCVADSELTDTLKLTRGEYLLLANTPFSSSHPGFDIYQKDFFLSAYIGVNCSRLSNAAHFVFDDGSPVFDMAMLFAANMRMQPAAELPTGVQVFFNQRVDETLNQTQDVKVLHEAGIAVLLSVLPSHDNAGWSCFDPSDARDVAAAEAFVEQLAHIAEAWDLDGIDIDNEYSTGTDYSASVTMVTALLQARMPDKIISGAWQPGDVDFFVQNPLTVYEPEPDPVPIFWRGGTLLDQLSYAWDMAYYDHNPVNRMYNYTAVGIPRSRLAIGFSQEKNPAAEVTAYLTGKESRQQIGGVMVYEVRRSSRAYISAVTRALLGRETHLDLALMKTWSEEGFRDAPGISEKCPPEGCQLSVTGVSGIMVGQPAKCVIDVTSDLPLDELPIAASFDAGPTGLVWPQNTFTLSVAEHHARIPVRLSAATAPGVAKGVISTPICKPATFMITVYSHALKFVGALEPHIFIGEAPKPPLLVRVVDHHGRSAGKGLRVHFRTSTVRPLLTLTQQEAETDDDGYVTVPVLAAQTAGYTSVVVSLAGAESVALSLYLILDRRVTFAWGSSTTITTEMAPVIEAQVEDYGVDGISEWLAANEGIAIDFFTGSGGYRPDDNQPGSANGKRWCRNDNVIGSCRSR